jgi:hypothetical protein
MRKLTTLTAAAALVAAFGFIGIANAGSGQKSAFALFDGSSDDGDLDNDNQTGALCGIKKGNRNGNGNGINLQIKKAFVYYVTVTANDSEDPEVDRVVRVVNLDGDSVLYKIPRNGSFAFTQVAGSGDADAAIRIVADENVSGSVSALGKSGVFCLSCGENRDGDEACDEIIETDGLP